MEIKDMVRSLDSEITRLTNARNLIAGEGAPIGTARKASAGRGNENPTGRRGPGRPKGSTNASTNTRGGARVGAGRPRGSGRDEVSATIASN